jgi:hypothetical protein
MVAKKKAAPKSGPSLRKCEPVPTTISPDKIDSVSGVHLAADEFLPNAKTGFWGLRYRLDSRMLVLVGAINEDEKQEGAFYYILENDHVRPIFSLRVEKRRCH